MHRSRRLILLGTAVLLGAVLAPLAAPPAQAQAAPTGQMGAPLRTIPDDARRGRMTHVQGFDVLLDGKATVLAPGVLIRDAQNMLVVPGALPAQAPVAYQTDLNGQINRIWVLTAQEAARPAAKK